MKEAEKAKNYRLATRYLFLNILKHLKEHHLISYQFQKTNADYKSELTNEDIKVEFTYTSRFYEFVWYGDFTLGKDEFLEAKTRFETFIHNIQNAKADG